MILCFFWPTVGQVKLSYHPHSCPILSLYLNHKENFLVRGQWLSFAVLSSAERKCMNDWLLLYYCIFFCYFTFCFPSFTLWPTMFSLFFIFSDKQKIYVTRLFLLVLSFPILSFLIHIWDKLSIYSCSTPIWVNKHYFSSLNFFFQPSFCCVDTCIYSTVVNIW